MTVDVGNTFKSLFSVHYFDPESVDDQFIAMAYVALRDIEESEAFAATDYKRRTQVTEAVMAIRHRYGGRTAHPTMDKPLYMAVERTLRRVAVHGLPEESAFCRGPNGEPWVVKERPS